MMRSLLKLFFLFVPLPPAGSGEVLWKETKRTLGRKRNWIIPGTLLVLFTLVLIASVASERGAVFGFILFFDFVFFWTTMVLVFLATLAWKDNRDKIEELRVTPFPADGIAYFQCVGNFVLLAGLLFWCAAAMAAAVPLAWPGWEWMKVAIPSTIVYGPIVLWFYFQSQLLAFALVLPSGKSAASTVVLGVVMGVVVPAILLVVGIFSTIFCFAAVDYVGDPVRDVLGYTNYHKVLEYFVPLMFAPGVLICGMLKSLLARLFFQRYRRRLAESLEAG